MWISGGLLKSFLNIRWEIIQLSGKGNTEKQVTDILETHSLRWTAFQTLEDRGTRSRSTLYFSFTKIQRAILYFLHHSYTATHTHFFCLFKNIFKMYLLLHIPHSNNHILIYCEILTSIMFRLKISPVGFLGYICYLCFVHVFFNCASKHKLLQKSDTFGPSEEEISLLNLSYGFI